MTNAMEFATKEEQAKITQMMAEAFNDFFYGESGRDREDLIAEYKDTLLRISQLMYKEQASDYPAIVFSADNGTSFMIRIVGLLDSAEEIALLETRIEEQKKTAKNAARPVVPSSACDTESGPSKLNPLFNQMIENLSTGIRTYGKTESEAMWTFYRYLDNILHQILGSEKTDGFDFSAIQALTMICPSKRRDHPVPEPICLAEYAHDLLDSLLNFTGAAMPTRLTVEQCEPMFNIVNGALEYLAEKFIQTFEHHYADIHSRLGTLVTIWEAIDPDRVLGKASVSQPSEKKAMKSYAVDVD